MLETTSESTAEKDKNKRKIYAQLGVAEYFQFDPFGEYLSPPLQGFRLVKGRYEPVRPNPTAPSKPTLGVLFRAEGKRLRLTDAMTGALLLRREEVDEKAEAEKQRADAEAQRADAEAEEPPPKRLHGARPRRKLPPRRLRAERWRRSWRACGARSAEAENPKRERHGDLGRRSLLSRLFRRAS